jgi:cobalt transporter subunit CbtA
MLARVLLAVLLCGVAAGVVMGVMQHVRLTPLILEAEKYETAEPHRHAAAGETAPAAHTHEHEADTWSPANGWERTRYTFLASMLSGTGFAALLASAVLLSGATIDRRNGWIWGFCGFLAVSLAPAAGLSPELPGMPAGDLMGRQFWWVSTIAATAAALWFLAFAKQPWKYAVIAALLVLPHIIGAPQPENHESKVPAVLASNFVASSLMANAVMWLVIGVLLGHFLPQTIKSETA